MIDPITRLLKVAVVASCLVNGAACFAADLDLNGLYKGQWRDEGRNLTRNNFRIRITHSGERITGVTTDNTIRFKGRLVENRILLEWDHSSGNYGNGSWEILSGGNRLKGSWDSKGSGRFFGKLDLVRQ